MKKIFFLVLMISTIVNAAAVTELDIIRILPHSGRGEGLDFYSGYLWEAEADDRRLKKINPSTGGIVKYHSSPTLYPESLVWITTNKLLHIDFKRRDVAVGEIDSRGKFRFNLLGSLKEIGFGMAKKTSTSFWVTGYYSPKIYLYSYPGLTILKTITTPLLNVEDLAWDGTYLWSSDFRDGNKKLIYRISATTGNVLETYHLPGSEVCDNTDGIAFNGNDMYITGKNCPLYVVEKPD